MFRQGARTKVTKPHLGQLFETGRQEAASSWSSCGSSDEAPKPDTTKKQLAICPPWELCASTLTIAGSSVFSFESFFQRSSPGAEQTRTIHRL
ncbi:hypothetical protein CGCA056_v007725 [Colletotrichum aenigma]|uniref:uncharacterized protein n=1 Tax=Colletotrichum aenigma TaxID=1215731 RepID=UPI0018731FF1|nr:uncharacterized protein CGCA056_v007725 [Colletotrichum aenigma]KAF5520485.1 hypothetical protein CGCA056_v007725 [Colletotrichum aenigma]